MNGQTSAAGAAPAVYSDLAGLSRLRHQAEQDPGAAVAEAARQFEAIFVGMMLKSMRDASPEGGLFNSDQMGAYRDMFDKQLALDLSAEGGIGLAPLIERQLGYDAAADPRS